MNMPVLRKDFAITQGATITRALKTGSGNINVQHFCEECLVRTHTEPQAHANIIYVRPGRLDDPAWVTPIGQIWTKRAHPWAVAKAVECFDENAPDPAALIRAWRVANA